MSCWVTTSLCTCIFRHYNLAAAKMMVLHNKEVGKASGTGFSLIYCCVCRDHCTFALVVHIQWVTFLSNYIDWRTHPMCFYQSKSGNSLQFQLDFFVINCALPWWFDWTCSSRTSGSVCSESQIPSTGAFWSGENPLSLWAIVSLYVCQNTAGACPPVSDRGAPWFTLLPPLFCNLCARAWRGLVSIHSALCYQQINKDAPCLSVL